MRFYVSGPVVDELNEKDILSKIYLLIQRVLDGHHVDLPLRSRDLDALSAERFYESVFQLIKSSDGIITVLSKEDQSGPVEATIASTMYKPQCIMEMSGPAPRLLRGLPQVVDVTRIGAGELESQVSAAIEQLLKNMTLR